MWVSIQKVRGALAVDNRSNRGATSFSEGDGCSPSPSAARGAATPGPGPDGDLEYQIAATLRGRKRRSTGGRPRKGPGRPRVWTKPLRGGLRQVRLRSVTAARIAGYLPAMATFPAQTLQFLADLEAHNDKAWFDEHRADYDRYYVAVGKAYLEALGERLGTPGKPMPGKMMRIFRDVRFSKDKTPYKPHLDVWFAESMGAEDAGWGPGLFARLQPTQFMVGMGCHDFEKGALEAFRRGVQTDGESLRVSLAALAEGGAEIGGSTLKRYPKGYAEDPLMLHTALHVGCTTPVPDDGVGAVVAAAKRFAPVNAWLKKHLSP